MEAYTNTAIIIFRIKNHKLVYSFFITIELHNYKKTFQLNETSIKSGI